MPDLARAWGELPPDVRTTLTRVAAAALVLLLVWLLRRLLVGLVIAPLRALARRTGSQWDDTLLDVLRGPARLLILAVGFLLAGALLEQDAAGAAFLGLLARTAIIAAIAAACFRAVDVLAPSSPRLLRATGLEINERLLPFGRTAAKLVIVALALIIIVQVWGYDANGLIAGLGLGGLAISLAAKDTVENLFGFTTIVGDQPFTVGDYIKTADVEGTVEKVGVRSTRVRQLDQSLVTVPNGKLASSVVTNWSRLHKRWVNLTLRITYDAGRASLEGLMAALRELLTSRDSVEADSVLVRFIGFGDHGYEILVRCYVFRADWGEFTGEREAIYLDMLRLIEERGLHIAFPARTFLGEAAPPPPPKA